MRERIGEQEVDYSAKRSVPADLAAADGAKRRCVSIMATGPLAAPPTSFAKGSGFAGTAEAQHDAMVDADAESDAKSEQSSSGIDFDNTVPNATTSSSTSTTSSSLTKTTGTTTAAADLPLPELEYGGSSDDEYFNDDGWFDWFEDAGMLIPGEIRPSERLRASAAAATAGTATTAQAVDATSAVVGAT
jgi:hypothetical protein